MEKEKAEEAGRSLIHTEPMPSQSLTSTPYKEQAPYYTQLLKQTYTSTEEYTTSIKTGQRL